jgi:hypothetical protein
MKRSGHNTQSCCNRDRPSIDRFPVLAQGAATKDNAHTYPGLTEDRSAPYKEEGEEICNDGPEWTQ